MFCRKSDQTEALTNPTIYNQEQSHGNNEATNKSVEEGDVAGGAPTEARRVGDQVTSQEAPLHEDEQNILHMLQERNYIHDIPVKNRANNQKKEYRILQTHLKGLNDEVNRVLEKFPHLKKKGPLTSAEKMAAQ